MLTTETFFKTFKW